MSLVFRVNIKEPYNVFYRVDRLTDQLDSYIKDIIRAKIPCLDLDEIFLDLVSIKEDMRQRLSAVLEHFGYILLDTLIVDLNPHKKVQESMNEIQVGKILDQGRGFLC